VAPIDSFTHPMMAGMERYASLKARHDRAVVRGPDLVSDRFDSFTLAALPRNAYTIHIGGGLRDRRNRVDHGACGAQGGVNAPAGMMGGHGMMGDGWRHSNGGYGMLFSFTTA
jgi:hypothetical protein